MDITQRKKHITDRIKELTAHLQKISDDLDQPLPAHLEDQAIDLEDDEVLEGIGRANQHELRLLQDALGRIADGSYGICQKCGEAISPARLDAVPHAMICRTCAAGD
ncbi:TraR/DksA family transcriptional regulator [Yoonia maricola]|uniref:TraR/DksA family transcriptional regulator n=1 Tax=Yoonia maricola TaxID=420999 RepID=A0A2M8WMC3_9RHOB|nr:TraR/DksA C4-type zinc finger protein [Yoonia maricola]PJI92075.1 TraR/DksA family transcriptional regulator [Yoonia maricola]